MSPERDDFGAFVPGARCEIGGAAQGALSGLHFAVKDLIDIEGDVTGCGNPDWRRTHRPAPGHAPVVERLLAAGACLSGKTITDELAFSLEGVNAHYGTPVNPRCPGRLPGGSSSGSVVAVAAGLVDFALGTDTGGSVRVPASFCGVFGFRPSHGRVSLDGVMLFAPSYDTVGWFARDLELLARVGDVLLGADQLPAPRRLLLARDAFALCDPSCAEALLAVARKLSVTAEITLFDGDEERWRECYRVLQGAEIWSCLGSWISATRPRFGAAIAPRFADAAQITAEQVTEFVPMRRRIAERLARLLPPDTVLLLPTAPCGALRTDLPPAEIGFFYQRALTLSCIAGHAGLPQLSLPAVHAEGCPVGLSLVGAPGQDEALFALAEQVWPIVAP